MHSEALKGRESAFYSPRMGYFQVFFLVFQGIFLICQDVAPILQYSSLIFLCFPLILQDVSYFSTFP